MEQTPDRTLLGSVLFADIVSYSTQPVQTQIAWKEFFNRSLSGALEPVNVDHRVILDTGDGAAICFLRAPETAIRCAMVLQSAFAEALARDDSAPRVRLGINLGPVQLMRDLNGHVNVVGDGINVGQRVMSFAGINQILVSRSYFEVVSWLSDDFRRLFRYEGAHLDKHKREHMLYSAVTPASERTPAPQPAAAPVRDVTPPRPAPAPLDSRMIHAVEQCLAQYTGPIASHMVRETLREISTPGELCGVLAEKAVPAADREAFLQRCREALHEVVSPPGHAETAWDEVFLDELKSTLARYLGPLSRVVVDRAARKASSREELYRLVAQDIDAETDRKAFLAARVSPPGSNS